MMRASGPPRAGTSDPRPLEPYRVLFPLGATCAIAGVVPWIVNAFRAGAWPGLLHADVMMEGFELSFVTGFLLTAMPAFTHGAKCRPWELAIVTAAVAAFAALRFAGLDLAAHAAFTLGLTFTAAALARRAHAGARTGAPPEEFALVAAGLALGIVGGVLQTLMAAGIAAEPSPRFAMHLLSRGMLLCIVLGLGGLLVPTFSLVPDPLRITFVAKAGERGPRRAFLAMLAATLVGAMLAEAAGRFTLAAWLRAAAGAASLMLAWKLWKRPGKNTRLAWSLWAAGAGVLLGLFGAALFPDHEIAAWHVVFIGGYGLLTLAIATRVVVSHGGHTMAEEEQVLGVSVLTAVAGALVLRLFSREVDPGYARPLAYAAALWVSAWLSWLAGALPRALRTKRALMMPGRR